MVIIIIITFIIKELTITFILSRAGAGVGGLSVKLLNPADTG